MTTRVIVHDVKSSVGEARSTAGMLTTRDVHLSLVDTSLPPQAQDICQRLRQEVPDEGEGGAEGGQHGGQAGGLGRHFWWGGFGFLVELMWISGGMDFEFWWNGF